jgi:molybdopterin-binding protein
MDCGFFCDTGVIYGLCYFSDDHKPACKSFVKKYPIKDHQYFYPSIVEDELENHKVKLSRKSKYLNKTEQGYARSFQMCVERLLKRMEHFDAKTHSEFIDIYKELLKELKSVIKITGPNQENDIEIASHAIIWSIITKNEVNSLITVDGSDLASKEEQILEMGENTSKFPINLKIIYVPGLFETA